MLTKDEVVSAALEAGFMLSTAHGQQTTKLMPVSDSTTLEVFARLIEKRIRFATDEISLRKEVEVLRRFGNKDCTAMADEELERIRTEGTSAGGEIG